MESRLPVIGTGFAAFVRRRRRRRLLRTTAVLLALTLAATVVHASVSHLSAVTASDTSVLPPAASVASPAAEVGDGASFPVRRPDPVSSQLGGSTAAAAGDAQMVLGPPAKVVYRVRTTQKIVALTFDDGWNPGAGRVILATLLRLHVPATFFVNSVYVRWDPKLWKAIAAAGFPIGNHTYDHRNLTTLTPARMVADIQRDAQVFLQLTGYAMAPIFRPPYGARDRAVDAAVLAAGYPTEVLWDTTDGDTSGWSDARELAAATAGRPGSIVLMHVGPASTPRILQAVVASYRARGFTFVTIPELLALRPSG